MIETQISDAAQTPFGAIERHMRLVQVCVFGVNDNKASTKKNARKQSNMDLN